MKRRVLRIFLQYALGVSLLVGVVWANWNGLEPAFHSPIELLPLLGAMLFCLTGIMINVVRWFVLVRAQDLPLTLLQAFRLNMIGYYFNAFLPGSVGGDLIKATCLAREQERRVIAVATVFVDRLIGLVSMLVLCLVTSSLCWLLGSLQHLEAESMRIVLWIMSSAAILVAAVVCVLLGIWFMPFDRSSLAHRLKNWPRVAGVVSELLYVAWIYRQKRFSLLQAGCLATLAQCCIVGNFAMTGLAFKPSDQLPSFMHHLVLVPTGLTLQAGVPAPGGVGGGELGFGFLYENFGSTFAIGVLVSLIVRSQSWLWGFVGYILYWQLKAK